MDPDDDQRTEIMGSIIKMTIATPRDQEIFTELLASMSRAGLRVDVAIRGYEVEIEIVETRN